MKLLQISIQKPLKSDKSLINPLISRCENSKLVPATYQKKIEQI